MPTTSQRSWKTKRIIWIRKYKRAAQIPCCRCKELLNHRKATLEHIIPKAFGGLNTASNYDLSHNECNIEHSKWVKKICDYIDWVANESDIKI